MLIMWRSPICASEPTLAARTSGASILCPPYPSSASLCCPPRLHLDPMSTVLAYFNALQHFRVNASCLHHALAAAHSAQQRLETAVGGRPVAECRPPNRLAPGAPSCSRSLLGTPHTWPAAPYRKSTFSGCRLLGCQLLLLLLCASQLDRITGPDVGLCGHIANARKTGTTRALFLSPERVASKVFPHCC
jgi:hypothetical protein